jgi:hypothetical protein
VERNLFIFGHVLSYITAIFQSKRDYNNENKGGKQVHHRKNDATYQMTNMA